MVTLVVEHPGLGQPVRKPWEVTEFDAAPAADTMDVRPAAQETPDPHCVAPFRERLAIGRESIYGV
jgi:hypothetical protein